MLNTQLLSELLLKSFWVRAAATLIALTSFNSQASDRQEFIVAAKQQSLSQHPIWHRLLHYEKGVLGTKSLISSDGFFFSEEGNTDPEAELKATIAAFYKNPTSQCKFPARKLWLQQQISNVTLPSVECNEYQDYRTAFSADSVSLVYASGYLGNPASMYGHILLKFNSSSNHELLDNTFSYGATVPETDNKLKYIVKGISGGYQGDFANQKYHHQNLTYNESELRDLWEYRLQLPQNDINFLLAHLWELENHSMTYYFFNENCAHQLARLLELVINKPLLEENKLWVMPYDVVKMVHDAGESSYLTDVIYHESRQESLYTRFKQLSSNEQQTIAEIIEQPKESIHRLLQQHDDFTAKKILDTLFDYYAFIDVKNKGLTETQIKKRKRLLIESFSLPIGQAQWEKPEKRPPHQSQNTTMMQVTPLYNESFGEGMEFRFRANYYDMLNLNAGRIPYSQLSTFDLRLLYTNKLDKWYIRELTLFDIINLNVSQTGLPEDKQYAWALAAGYKPTSLDCVDCSNPYVNGFIGQSTSLFEDFAGYIALSSELNIDNFKKANLLSGPEIGGVWTVTPYWKTSIKLGSHFYINDIGEYQNYLAWTQRFLNDRRIDLRTSVQYADDFEYAVNLSFYW